MESLETLKPEFYREIDNEDAGLKSFLVVDRCVFGHASGGIRLCEGLTLDEVANLAREMTIKYGFLNIKKDGAKAGIVAPPGMDSSIKKKLCIEFGRQIRPFVSKGLYSPGEDLGMSYSDMLDVNEGMDLQDRSELFRIKSEYYTALTGYITLNEICKVYLNRLKGKKITIDGFGKVGEAIAKFLHNHGSLIVGISTLKGSIYQPDGLLIEELESLRSEYGDDCVNYYSLASLNGKDALLGQETDILILAGSAERIHNGNVDAVKAKVVLPIANIAMHKNAQMKLESRKIISVPSYVANCGGVLAYFFKEQGFNNKEIEEMICEGFPGKVEKLIQKAEQKTQTLYQAAQIMAKININRMEEDDKHVIGKIKDFKRMLWILFKYLQRAKMGFILNPFAKKYIQKRLFES